jgi:hypothetical protein
MTNEKAVSDKKDPKQPLPQVGLIQEVAIGNILSGQQLNENQIKQKG